MRRVEATIDLKGDSPMPDGEPQPRQCRLAARALSAAKICHPYKSKDKNDIRTVGEEKLE
jgi:hypothetical protein